MNFVLEGLLAEDISRATDLITRSDATSTALPNRVLYDLMAEFDRVTGKRVRLDADFNGSLAAAANSVARTIDMTGGPGWQAPLFDAFNRRLRAGGHADFKPSYPDWPAP
jgi:hypothetical protein